MKFEDLWRPVETGDADKMEFCRGGGKPLVRLGYFSLCASVLLFGMLLLNTSLAWRVFSDALHSGDYNEASFVFVGESVLSLLIFENFLLGALMIWGRTDVVLNRIAKSITKKYRMSSFCYYSKDYKVGSLSSFLFRRKIRSFAILHFVCLTDEKSKRRRVLIIPRKFALDGWTMAEQMASFLGIPLRDKTVSG